MNTATRASFANADQCHASTSRTPLLRSYGLVMPQATTKQPSFWDEHPNMHCQTIALEYKDAIAHESVRLPITPTLLADASAWLHAELAKVTSLGFWPIFTPNNESLLCETIAAFNQPTVNGETITIPITGLYNEDKHPVWTPLENLLFRFVHDYHHWVIGADATFIGELAVTRHIFTPAVRQNDALARFLASEIIGQAATTITSGSHPAQIIARNILDLI